MNWFSFSHDGVLGKGGQSSAKGQNSKTDSSINLVQTLTGHSERIWEAKFSDIDDIDLWNVIISCSGESTRSGGELKLWDKRQGDCVISATNPNKAPLFCLDNTDNMIVTGSSETVQLWDLRKMKVLHNFTELHSNDVTSVKISKQHNNLILTASEDYLWNLLDTKESELEDEYLEASYTSEQPLSKCNFISNSSLAYLISNVNTIEILDLDTMLVKSKFDCSKQSEKLETIISAQEVDGNLLFYIGDFAGRMYIYRYNINQAKEEVRELYCF